MNSKLKIIILFLQIVLCHNAYAATYRYNEVNRNVKHAVGSTIQIELRYSQYNFAMCTAVNSIQVLRSDQSVQTTVSGSQYSYYPNSNFLNVIIPNVPAGLEYYLHINLPQMTIETNRFDIIPGSVKLGSFNSPCNPSSSATKPSTNTNTNNNKKPATNTNTNNNKKPATNTNTNTNTNKNTNTNTNTNKNNNVNNTNNNTNNTNQKGNVVVNNNNTNQNANNVSQIDSQDATNNEEIYSQDVSNPDYAEVIETSNDPDNSNSPKSEAENKKKKESKSDGNNALLIGICTGFFGILLVGLAAFVFYPKAKKLTRSSKKNNGDVTEEQINMV